MSRRENELENGGEEVETPVDPQSDLRDPEDPIERSFEGAVLTEGEVRPMAEYSAETPFEEVPLVPNFH